MARPIEHLLVGSNLETPEPQKLSSFNRLLIWANRQIPGASEREASIVAQANYDRRIAAGQDLLFESQGKKYRIVGITKGDDQGGVLVSDGEKVISVAALHLERIEEARAALGAIDEVVPPGPEPEVVPTAARPRSAPAPSVLPAPSGPKYRVDLGTSAVVDVTKSAEDMKRDAAEIELHAEKGSAGIWDRFIKYNLAHEEYRQRGMARAAVRQAGGNITAAHDPEIGRAVHQRMSNATIDRFKQNEAEFLHSESKDGKDGERKRKFGDTPEEAAVKAEYIELIREYAANPAMDEKVKNSRRDAIFAKISKLSGDVMEGGKMFFHDLDRLAEHLRQHEAAAHGMENLDIDLDIVVGRAKVGARTEREKNMVDSAIEKLHKYTGGILHIFDNEVAVAVAATVGMGVAVGRSVLSSTAAKLTTFGGSGLISGVYGWWKEKGRLRSEQALHEREVSMGGKLRIQETPAEMNAHLVRLNAELAALPFLARGERARVKAEIAAVERNETDQPRRKEMQEFELCRRSAKELADGAMALMIPGGRELKPGIHFTEAASILAEIEARIRISNLEKVDLLSYTSIADAEVERRNLDLARMQLKATLREMYDSDTTIDKTTYANFQAYYDYQLSLREDQLFGKDSEGRAQQRKFRAWSQDKALKRGVMNVVMGAGIGLIAHDLWTWASDSIDHTTTAGVIHWFKDLFNHTPVPQTGPLGQLEIDGGTIVTPAGTELYPQADGTFTLETTADHHVLVDGIRIDSQGHITPDGIAKIEGIGGHALRADGWIDASNPVEHIEKDATWIQNHPEVEHIARDDWKGNNTPMHFVEAIQKWVGADWNETKLWWGGINNTGLDEHGQIVMSMGHMTKDGSFQGALSNDAPAEIVTRKIRLLLSMNDHTQNYAVEVMADQHGNFHIDPLSDVGKTFFKVENGHAVFLGRFAEVGVSKGFDAENVNHFSILATHEGHGIMSGITTVSSGECIPNDITQISLPPVHETHDIPLPWIAPIRGRVPLEPVVRNDEEETGDDEETDDDEEELSRAA